MPMEISDNYHDIGERMFKYLTNNMHEDEIIERLIKERNVKSPLSSVKLENLNERWEKTYQLLATIAWLSLVLFVGPALCSLFLLLAWFTFWPKYVIIAYLMWMYIDRKTCERGGRRSDWFRKLKWWEYFRDFFPVKLVKTTDLAPDKNYLFAAYPHGILSTGVYSTFVTDALDFENVFKGLKPYPCTLNIVFNLPVIREIALATGLNSVSENSINWILGSEGKGRAAIVVVGGATEASNCKPGPYRIILERRKGFCRLALENGSPLVPVFSFGETDLYETITPKPGSFFESLQFLIKKITGAVPVLFFGGRMLILPRQKPITVVVGKPIEVQQVKNPTKEQIDELHKKYKESLIKLFNEGKVKYLKDPKTELIIE